VVSFVLKSARNRVTTSDARLPSRMVRRAVFARTVGHLEGSAASMRRQVLALVMIPDSGWLTSCAIDAVNAPRLVTLATCASSDLTFPSVSSDRRCCVTVLSRADVYQSTLSVSRSVTDQVQIFDRVVGHLQPVFVFKIATDASRPVDHVIQHRDIFRMDSTTDQFKRYRYIPVKLKNAIKLL